MLRLEVRPTWKSKSVQGQPSGLATSLAPSEATRPARMQYVACVPSYYPIQDISTWPVVSQEFRGNDPKDWVAPVGQEVPGSQTHWWLFKPVKSANYRRYDDWSERIAADLAALIDLPAAEIQLAEKYGQPGIISRNVAPDLWSMESGDTLLSDLDGYISCAGDPRPVDRIGHNLKNIKTVLDGCTGPPETHCESWRAVEVFAGYLLFDAWIANTDRHAENWAVLTSFSDGRRALAASFDHGSSLASGTQDERLTATGPRAYAKRGYARSFEHGKKYPLSDLALDAVTDWGGRSTVWIDRLRQIAKADVEEIVGRIEGMSDVRRSFICSLLETTRTRITS